MKRDGRTLARDVLEEMRIQAVQRMHEGESPAAVAASFGMNRVWAYKCWALAAGRGKELPALRSTKGTGRPRSLTPMQEHLVFRWVNGKSPRQYDLDFGLWTRQAVGELVEQRFAVTLSLAGVGVLFARLGLTPQKPLQGAYQRNRQAAEHWSQNAYPAIARQAKREKAEIFFWNESGFRADAVPGKTCGAKGQAAVAEPAGQWQSISAASAVNSRGAFWLETYPGALTGELFVGLLKNMMTERDRPVHLVADGLPAHRKSIVKEYVASTRGALTLHLLSGDEQALNPEQRGWSYAGRTGVTGVNAPVAASGK